MQSAAGQGLTLRPGAGAGVSGRYPRLPPRPGDPAPLPWTTCPGTEVLGRFLPASRAAGSCTCQATHKPLCCWTCGTFSSWHPFSSPGGRIEQLSRCRVNAVTDLSSHELATEISAMPGHLAAAYCFQLWSRTSTDRSIHLVLGPPRSYFVVLGIQAVIPSAHLLPWHLVTFLPPSFRHWQLLVQSPHCVSFFLSLVALGVCVTWRASCGAGGWEENTLHPHQRCGCSWLRCGGLHLGGQWRWLSVTRAPLHLPDLTLVWQQGVEGWERERSSSTTSVFPPGKRRALVRHSLALLALRSEGRMWQGSVV